MRQASGCASWGRVDSLRLVGALGLSVVVGASSAAGQHAAQPVFPRPFVVEHRIIDSSAGNGVFETPPVTDYYGGSWIVSVRPDDSRLIVDFARREITEVRPAAGSYSVLTFDRMADLRRRYQRADAAPGSSAKAEAVVQASVTAAEKRQPPEVRELGLERSAAEAAQNPLLARPGVKRLRVTALSAPRAGAATATRTSAVKPSPAELEVWLDPAVSLGEGGRAALAALEAEVLGGIDAVDSPSALLAAARDHARGAFPIKTRRTSGDGVVEDVATRLEALPVFPLDLLEIPEGYRRVPHPLEVMVAWAEEEAERAAKTAR